MDGGQVDGIERVIGAVSAGTACGPLLLVTVAVHGNEPAGLQAARRVLQALEGRVPLRCGRCVALVGNRAALARDARFVDEDLNRLWSPDRVAQLDGVATSQHSTERREQRELLAAIERELASLDGPVTHLDLHSTSGAGPPFTLVSGPPASRVAADSLRVPTLTGIEALVAGTLIEHVGARGHAALIFEGGQHRSPATVERHEAALWLSLNATGLLRACDVPGGLEAHVACLDQAAADLPRAIEIEYVHRLEPGEAFEMLPGFTNFQPIDAGRLLARSGPGLAREVRAPRAGILLMPRYQGQGLDGFFLGRVQRSDTALTRHGPSG